mmetsp:Transcript_82713/g.252808  ORF Transcript_82713/g.252808 Transcript_82713/m.252808 type:complete len:214 (-) Transcript_82713:372-1013(-)
MRVTVFLVRLVVGLVRRVVVQARIPLALHRAEPVCHSPLQYNFREEVVDNHVKDEHHGHLPLEIPRIAIVRPDAAELRDLRARHIGGGVTLGGLAPIRLGGQPILRTAGEAGPPALFGHFVLPHLHLRPEEAASHAARGEGRQDRQAVGVQGAPRIAAHPVNTIVLGGGRQQQPEQAKEEARVDEVDTIIEQDVPSEAPTIGVHIRRVDERQH